MPASWCRVEAISAASPAWSALSWAIAAFWSSICFFIAAALARASASSSPRAGGGAVGEPSSPKTSGRSRTKAPTRRHDGPRRRDGVDQPSAIG